MWSWAGRPRRALAGVRPPHFDPGQRAEPQKKELDALPDDERPQFGPVRLKAN
ncbi:hypothetical protein [Streptomyces nigrescens]